jgi:hypothetical protein
VGISPDSIFEPGDGGFDVVVNDGVVLLLNKDYFVLNFGHVLVEL